MAETYLSVARWGRNDWWRYGLSLLLALGLTINTTIYLGLPLMIVGVLQDFQLSEDFLVSHPVPYLTLTIVVSGLMVLGLILAIASIHKRPWRTVINPQGVIRWRRMLQGFVVWLALTLIVMGLLAWLARDRYSFQFDPLWLWLWVPVLLAIPGIVLMSCLVYGYLLQGLGLLVRRPLRLTVVVAILVGLLDIALQPTAPNGFDWVLALIGSGFIVWITLQDNGLELFMGVTAADWLMSLQILRSPDETPVFPTLLVLNSNELSLAGFLAWLARLGVFYSLCFFWFSSTGSRGEPVHLSKEAANDSE